MFVFTLLIIASASFFGGFGRQLDSTKCHINDPDLGNCVLKSLNSLSPEIESGDKTNRASFDPFTVPMFHIVQESTVVNYTGMCRNYSMRGMDNYEVKEVSFDPKTMTFRGRVEYGTLALVCDYEMEGQLVMIPVRGKGVVRVALGPINATVEVHGEMKESSSAFFNPTGIKLRLVIDDLGINMDGLFDGNVELGIMTNAALNANSKMFADGVTPMLEKLGERIFLKSMKHISKKVITG